MRTTGWSADRCIRWISETISSRLTGGLVDDFGDVTCRLQFEVEDLQAEVDRAEDNMRRANNKIPGIMEFMLKHEHDFRDLPGEDAFRAIYKVIKSAKEDHLLHVDEASEFISMRLLDKRLEARQ